MRQAAGPRQRGRAGGVRQAARQAVFLDKDGTLVEDVPWNVDPALVTLAPGAGEALALLRRQGYQLFVVSNQCGVARGLFPESALQAVFQRLQDLLDAWKVSLDGFYYCPHAPAHELAQGAAACDCRKPLPGMLLQAAQEHDIDLAASWMVGDILHDVEAGHRAGCRSILIDNGSETEWDVSGLRQPDARLPDLLAAARCIVAESIPAALTQEATGIRKAGRRNAPGSAQTFMG